MDLDDFSQNVESLLAELAATEAQRARYQALFELAPDPAILTDRGGAIAEVNRAAARLLDAAPAALVGAKLAGIMRPSVSLPDEGRTLLTWQGELQPPGGAGFPATACAVIVPDEQGRPVYWRWSFSRTSDVGSGRETPESTKTPPERHLPQTVAQFEDKMAGRTGDLRRAGERLRHELSERQQAEARLRASEGRFRSIYEYSAIGIGLLDESGHLLDVNPAGLAMFGIADPAQIRSLNLFEASNVLPRLLDRLRRGESVRYEAPLDFAKVKAAGLYDTTRSGVRRMEFIVTPIGAPQPGFLVQVQDMTERVRAGELSQALNAINAAINATFDVEQVLAEVAYTAQEALAADSAIVTVQEPDGGWRIRSVVGLPIEIVGRVLNAAEVPYSTLAAQTHTPIVVPNIDNTSPGLEQLAAVYGVCAALITPLALRQDVIGAFIFNYHAVPLALT
jgi:PAS domain S-box-containing protein